MGEKKNLQRVYAQVYESTGTEAGRQDGNMQNAFLCEKFSVVLLTLFQNVGYF